MAESVTPQPRRFAVYSPVYETWSQFHPPESGADYVEVECETRSDARLMGAKLIEKQGYDNWCRTNRSDGKPPWLGLTIEELE